MRYISYRSKLRLRGALTGALIAVLVLAALGIGAFLYLARYIVYTPEGARLDFSAGQDAASPLGATFQVERPDPIPGAGLVADTGPKEPQTITRITGYYADSDMLTDPEGLRAALRGIATPAAVLLDVRSIYGNFYYPSALDGAQTSTLINATAVEALIRELAANPSLYLIAWLPALRDPAYALAHQSCGLSLPSGALWMDSEGCYWLDPDNDQVVGYLEQTARELQGLGFDEVVFDDFHIPDGAAIYYKGDAANAVTEAARRLQANLDGIAVSFSTQNAALAHYAAHIFFKENDGAQVSALAAPFAGALEPLSDHLVFLTSSRDTRFEAYCVLRPALESGG